MEAQYSGRGPGATRTLYDGVVDDLVTHEQSIDDIWIEIKKLQVAAGLGAGGNTVGVQLKENGVFVLYDFVYTARIP